MKLFLILAASGLLTVSCTTTPTSNEGEKIETPSPSGPKIELAEAKELIFAVVDGDECSKELYLWGKPEKNEYAKHPKGYGRGLALTVAQVACDPQSDLYKVATKAVGDAGTDALAHYGVTAENQSLRLSNTAALMIGSNLRESSWRPCVGRDVGAKESDVKGCLNGTYNGVKYTSSGSTCEAGLDQGSYNSVVPGVLRDLFNAFADYPKGCFKTEFYGSTTCTAANWQNHGSDPKALQYQQMAKECPGYTVQSGFARFRTNRKHYGPLNTKKAELKKSCVARFEKVQKLVKEKPAICAALL